MKVCVQGLQQVSTDNSDTEEEQQLRAVFDSDSDEPPKVADVDFRADPSPTVPPSLERMDGAGPGLITSQTRSPLEPLIASPPAPPDDGPRFKPSAFKL